MEPVESHRGRAARQIAGHWPDFAVTLLDGRRVVGQHRDGEWAIYVYAYADDDWLLGYGTDRARPRALEDAGLSGDDAGEVLGRAGI